MRKLKQIGSRIASSSEGQTMSEYAVVLTTVALVAIAGFALLPGPIVSAAKSVAVLLP
jgi:Flp pilus assembly pilin Flp